LYNRRLEADLLTVDLSETEEKKAAEEVSSVQTDAGGGEPAATTEKEDTTKKPGDEAAASIVVDDKPAGDAASAAEAAATEKKDKDLGGAPGDEDANESPSYLHAAQLHEEGVLPNLELETLKGKEPAEVFKAINAHIQTQMKEGVAAGVDQYKNGFGERAKQLLEALDKGIPLDSLEESFVAEERYGNIKDRDLADDEALQKQVYSDLLSMKGFAPEKVTRMVEKATTDGELEQESKDGLVEIKTAISDNRKAIDAQALEDKKDRDDKNAEIKLDVEKAVTDIKEVIPGVTFSDKERAAVIENMTVPVRFENRNGRQIPVSRAMELRSKDVLDYELKLNYFIEKGFFDQGSKFDAIVRKAETTASSKLLKKMGSEPRQTGATTVKGTEGQETAEKPFLFPDQIQ